MGYVRFEGPSKRKRIFYRAGPGVKRRYTPPSYSRQRKRNQVTSGFLGIEKKFLDMGGSSALVAPNDMTGGELQPSSGCTNCISAPAQGDGEENRDGKKIIITSCMVRGNISWALQQDQADALAVGPIYVAIVQNKQTNAAALNSEDVFKALTANTGANFKPFRNLLNSTRFKVLADTTITPPTTNIGQDSAATTSQDLNNSSFELYWNGKMPVHFNSTTTANVSAVVDNSITLIAFATTTVMTPTATWQARIRFVG
jgi:hypothetical protein